MGHAVKSEFKAQMGLGTIVPYIIPLMIHAQLSRRIKESKRHSLSEKLNGWIFRRFQKPINALSKGTLYLAIWFSRRHYLTVREPSRHTCQLALVSVRFLLHYC